MLSTILAILEIVRKLQKKPHPALLRVLRLSPVDVAFGDMLILSVLAALHMKG